ncbi:hypothetical protein N9D42_01895 [Candidatus Thioglobus sp.]|nr:hypothetical protein [Candidatus Thioglobus sp.]
MKKLLLLLTLVSAATFSLSAVANDDKSMEAARTIGQIEAFDLYCGAIEMASISLTGSIYMDMLYEENGGISNVRSKYPLEVEMAFTERAVLEDTTYGVVVCAKLRERLKRQGLWNEVFERY